MITYTSTGDKYYTVSESCKALGVTRATIYRWIRTGNLNAVRISGRVYVNEEQINMRVAMAVPVPARRVK